MSEHEMICPKCLKGISTVSIKSICFQTGTLDKNQVVDYWDTDIQDTVDIFCPECDMSIEDSVIVVVAMSKAVKVYFNITQCQQLIALIERGLM